MKIYVIPQMGRLTSYLLALTLSQKPKVNFFGFMYCESSEEKTRQNKGNRFWNRNIATTKALIKIQKDGSFLHKLAKSTVGTIMELVMKPKGGDSFILGGIHPQVVNGLYARFLLEKKPTIPTKEEGRCRGFVLTFENEKLTSIERFDKPTWIHFLNTLS